MSNYYAASDPENGIVLLASTSEDADELNTCFKVLKLHEDEITMGELLIDDEELKEMFAATVDEELSNVETSIAVEHESDVASSGYILKNSDSQYLTRLLLE